MTRHGKERFPLLSGGTPISLDEIVAYVTDNFGGGDHGGLYAGPRSPCFIVRK